MVKRICILGSTGSIGRSALSVIEAMPDELAVRSLAAGRDWKALAEQTRRHRPRMVAISDGESAERLAHCLNGSGTRVLGGASAMEALAGDPETDVVVCAVVGSAGLPAALAAARAGKTIALANKEALVVAGELLTDAVRRGGATLLPVDSEHSAVFQAARCGRAAEIQRVILTASGGPFRTWSADRIANATVEQALNHPTWQMGPKVTVDSASLMNKALEVIEARFLFNLPPERIEVLVHPESLVHSMVEFVDGSMIAQLGPTDMRSPIQYALTWPRRAASVCGRLELDRLRTLSFEPPDRARFGALDLGYRVARAGGLSGAVLNGANEAAVEAFLAGRIRFGRIIPLVRRALDEHERTVAAPDTDPAAGLDGLDGLQSADRRAREQVNTWIG